MAVPALVAVLEHARGAIVPPAQARVWFDLELVGLLVGLTVLVAIGAVVALKSRALVKIGDEAPSIEHSREHYQDLLDRGLLDSKEFERIVALLDEQPPAPPAKP